MPRNFSKSDNDWFIRDCGDEIVTLQSRDTGKITTMHFDELCAEHEGGDFVF